MSATIAATRYHLAQRPYGVVDAVNRVAAATGSVRYALAASDADYNGHRVSVTFNDYRGYWIAQYTWAGRVVLARGALAECLRAAKAEYDRGALGAEVVATYSAATPGDQVTPPVSAADFERLCVEAGYEVAPSAGTLPSWWTPLHDKVGEAISWEKHGLGPAVSFLVSSKTVEEYEAKLSAYNLEAQAARRAASPGRRTLSFGDLEGCEGEE